MNRHLLENMLEVHLAHISPLHCHSADDRNIRIHHEEGEKNILSSNVNPYSIINKNKVKPITPLSNQSFSQQNGL